MDASSQSSLESLTRPELERLYLAQKELERRHKEAPLLSYRLMLARHPKQRQFHEAGKTPGVRYRLFQGANRSGKTTAGGHEAIAYAYGYRFWEVPDLKLIEGDLPPREVVAPEHWIRRPDGIPIRVPNVGMALSGLPRLRGIGEVMHPAIFNRLPAEVRKRAKMLRGAQSVPDWLELPNGSRILYATAEQDVMTFEGFVLDWAWSDEPPPAAIFNALQARLFDYRGAMWFTLTPLGAVSAWLYETFVNPSESRTDSFIIKVTKRDNPGLTEEQIVEEERNNNYSPRERAARLLGEFEFLGDRVFELFNPTVHIIKSFVPPDDWIRLCVVDPHHKRPAAIIWAAYDQRSSAYHIYREFPGGGDFHKRRDGALPPAELATVIRNAEGRSQAQHRICDPRFGPAEHTRHGFHETSFVKLMAEYGLHFDANVPNTGKIEYGIDVINDLLRYDKNFPLSPSNKPKLFVHDCCLNVATSFMNFGYTDVSDPIKGLYKKVSEEYKDFSDCVRYLVLYPIPVTAEQAKKLQSFTEDDLKAYNDYAID